MSALAFADANVEATADFTRFDREFPAQLRQAVLRATRSITADFRRAGDQAGRAFADGIAGQLRDLANIARVEGARAGRAFAQAAQQFTRNIDVGFDVATSQGARFGAEFRAAATRFTQAIPVSFAANPSARLVGVVTGQRFRAGAIAGMGQIPVDFDISSAATEGTAAGRAFRTAAGRQTTDIPVSLGTRGSGATPDSGGIFSFLSGLSGRMKLIIALAPLLGSALSGATVALSGFIGSLLPLGGLLAAGPAGFALLIASFTTIGLAAKRLGEVIKTTLAPAFQTLRDQVAATAVAGLDRELQAVSRTISGPFRQGAVEAAGGLNALLTATARFFGLASTGNAIKEVFRETGNIFRDLATSAPVVLRGLSDITVAVLPAFNSLSDSLSRILITFGNFLTRSAQSGQAFIWVQTALETLKDLSRILINVGSAFVSIFSAASSVTGDLVDGLARVTGTFARFLDSAEGTQQLETIFKALAIAALPFVRVVEALLPALGPIANVINSIFQALSPLLTIFAQLVTSLVSGLQPVINALLPVLSGLTQGISDLLAPLAPVIVQLGEAIGAALLPVAQQLGDIFRQLGPALAPLVVALVQALLPVIQQIGPLLVAVLDAFLPLLPAIIDLVPPVTQLVVALTPLITVLAQLAVIAVQILVPFIKFSSEMTALVAVKVIVPVITALAKALEFIAPALNAILGPLQTFSRFLGRLNLRQLATEIGTGLGNAMRTAGQAVSDFVSNVVGFFASLPQRIGTAIAAIPGIVAGIFSQMVSLAFESLGFFVGRIIAFFADLATNGPSRLAAFGDAVIAFFVNLKNNVLTQISQFVINFLAFLGSLPEQVPILLAALGTLISNFFTNMWNSAVATVRQGVENVIAFVRSIPDRLRGFIAGFRDVGGQLIEGLMNGLLAFGNRAANFVNQIVSGLKKFINDNVIGPLERGLNRGLGGFLNLSLPRLEHGAIITQPTIAQLGEGGKPEVVIPLTNPSRAQQLVDESGLANMVNMDRRTIVNVNVRIGERELTDIVRTETDQALAEQGETLFAGPRVLGG